MARREIGQLSAAVGVGVTHYNIVIGDDRAQLFCLKAHRLLHKTKNTETDRNKQEVQKREKWFFHVCSLGAFLRSSPWLSFVRRVQHLLPSCIRHLHVCSLSHMSGKGQARRWGKAAVTRRTVTHNDSQKRGGRGAAASAPAVGFV